MSHVPGGLCYKKLRNIIRPANGGGPTPPFGFVWFYGHNSPNPPETVEGQALVKREEWEAFLVPSYDILTFESETPLSPFFGETRVINGISVSMPMPTMDGSPLYDPNNFGFIADAPDLLGRFNTTTEGQNYLENMLTLPIEEWEYDPLSATRFEFSPPISVFGCYFTDIGDFTGTLTARVTATDLTTQDYVLSTGSETNGYLTFLGFIDGSKTYSKIEFFCSAGNEEGWGMDDIVAGPLSILSYYA